MEELLEYIVKGIVVNKSDIVIRAEETDTSMTLQICVNKEDEALVIGKNGSVINAICDIIQAAARGKPKRYFVEIADDAVPIKRPFKAASKTAPLVSKSETNEDAVVPIFGTKVTRKIRSDGESVNSNEVGVRPALRARAEGLIPFEGSCRLCLPKIIMEDSVRGRRRADNIQPINDNAIEEHAKFCIELFNKSDDGLDDANKEDAMPE